MACSCKKPKLKVTQNGFDLDIHAGYTIYTVVFNANRVLRSRVTNQTSQITKDHTIDVYDVDLVYWVLQQGVNGISFVNPEQEVQFLIQNPSVKRERYS